MTAISNNLSPVKEKKVVKLSDFGRVEKKRFLFIFFRNGIQTGHFFDNDECSDFYMAKKNMIVKKSTMTLVYQTSQFYKVGTLVNRIEKTETGGFDVTEITTY